MQIRGTVFFMLPLWIEFFDDLQQVRGRSQNTVMAYRRDLELWQEYKKESSSVSGFFDFMKSRKLSERSQARVISSVRTYYRFIQSRGLEAKELQELKPPKIETKAPKPLSKGDFEKLYECAVVPSEARTRRNHLTLLLLYGTGVRVTELISMNIADVNFDEAKIRIAGKAGKERFCTVSENILNQLEDYLTTSREFLRKGETDSIIVNDRGKRPSRIDLWRWLAAWSEKAGFNEPVSPHQFRHGCAANLLQEGKKLSDIKDMLGHASIQTTQMYAPLVKKQQEQQAATQTTPVPEAQI
jgi:integrase/recombinase XerD